MQTVGRQAAPPPRRRARSRGGEGAARTHYTKRSVSGLVVDPSRVRRRFTISGVVQGVGFRPFVFALARRLSLAGFVSNTGGGVIVEVEGPAAAVEQFACGLVSDAPPLAEIAGVRQDEIPVRHEQAFTIADSARPDAAAGLTPVPPDTAVCDACLAELRDPANRRYRYPFIACTHCGPRFTIVMDTPYDRPQTTMRRFPLCAACAAEYEDPGDRRFHAQPTACPACGPRIWLHHPLQRPLHRPPHADATGNAAPEGAAGAEGDAAIAAVQAAVLDGRIVAIKGIGGFHLACDATNAAAVERLRERKGRGDKPFALMAKSLDIVDAYAHVSAESRAWLERRERPIVLLPRRDDRHVAAGVRPLPDAVAPGQSTLGFLLPYAPLHHLLLDGDAGARPWIMTSGNRSHEPIARDNDEALARLADIADRFLLHDRDIHVVCDDSVLRATPAGPIPIRRARGFTPSPLRLPHAGPAVLATGGDLKAAFCLTRDDVAIMSQHVGDTEYVETLEAFERAIDHFRALFRVAPAVIACDLHPGYHSSAWAAREARRAGVPLVRVQHHHAHAAAVMAEHGHDGRTPVIAVTFDGTGYGVGDRGGAGSGTGGGSDNGSGREGGGGGEAAIWGGEVLIAGYRGFTRHAHLRAVPLVGGDAAIRHPARVALMHLAAAGLAWDADLPPVPACSTLVRRILARQLSVPLSASMRARAPADARTAAAGTVQTTSMGRLFDAVASLIGLRHEASYEGQAAMELEACAIACDPDAPLVGFSMHSVPDGVSDGPADGLAHGSGLPRRRHASATGRSSPALLIDPGPLLASTIDGLRRGESAGVLAGRFQEAVVRMIVATCEDARAAHDLHEVALSGGVFQNAWLLQQTDARLRASGFRVLRHERVPPNDGGLALGQAAIAVGMATDMDAAAADW